MILLKKLFSDNTPDMLHDMYVEIMTKCTTNFRPFCRNIPQGNKAKKKKKKKKRLRNHSTMVIKLYYCLIILFITIYILCSYRHVVVFLDWRCQGCSYMDVD